MYSRLRALALSILVAGFSASLLAQVSVTTYHNDNMRTGQNTTETFLTTANVNPTTFGKLFAGSVGLDSWGAAQPLYVPGVLIDGVTHNVVYVATINNSVYAFDADTGALLWNNNFEPVTPFADLCTDSGYARSPSGGAGIVGTPAIDTVAGIMYFVSKTGTGTGSSSYELLLHAVNITTGLDETGSPVTIVPTVGPLFQPEYQMSRPAVLLSGGYVYIGLGSTGCKGLEDFPKVNNHGYIMRYDTYPNLQDTPQTFVTTPSPTAGDNGGVWQGGGGIAEDSEGNLYFETADATFDANKSGQDYGDSVIKLDPNLDSPPLDYFTPYNQGTLLNPHDLDMGSVGPVILPVPWDNNGVSTPLLVASGKIEEIFVLNQGDLGEYCSTCATYNTNIVEDVERPSYLSGCQPPVSGPLTCRYGSPSYWNDQVYFPGEQAPLLTYTYSPSGAQPLSTSPSATSANSYPFVGPVSISADGTSNGIAWSVTETATTATLRAFDAISLEMLYNTDAAAKNRDTLGPSAHFITPTIANGKVYVATQGQLLAYGLFPQLNPSSGNFQTAQVNTPITLSVQAVNPYTGQGISGVAVTFSDNAKVHGIFSPNPATTVNGIATTTYTLPKGAGTVTVTGVSTGYSTATFTETAIPGPPASVSVFSGNSQSGVVGTTLTSPLVSVVRDAYSNAVPGAQVTYNDGGLGGTFQPSATVISASNGQATVTYTLPLVAKTGFPITASSGSATAATFHETSLAGVPASIVTNGGNKQTGTHGTQLPKPLSVQVKDQYGNAVSNFTVNFTDNGAGGTFTNSAPTTNSQGIASTSYTLPSTPGTWTITASAGSVSVNFTETGD